MRYTYDLNGSSGCLIIYADSDDKTAIRELARDDGSFSAEAEWQALESLVANSELDWISPEECGDLTDAPLLGIRDENGNVQARWGFMDYQLRSFLQDLIDDGRATFVGGN